MVSMTKKALELERNLSSGAELMISVSQYKMYHLVFLKYTHTYTVACVVFYISNGVLI